MPVHPGEQGLHGPLRARLRPRQRRAGHSDAAVAYDAFTALQRTANYGAGRDLGISAATSAGALSGGEIHFDGASGYVALGNRSVGQASARVPLDKPVLVLEAGHRSPLVKLACGRFARGQERPTWGPDDANNCPDID